jgi:tetratricopeptide (TPR) repeat protein
MHLKPQRVVDKKLNTIIAFIVFAISIGVYWMTQARSLSLWDAGEYITCSSILGVPHPPGNPFYILLGRFICLFGFNIPHAMLINLLSGIFSAFAVMFTYLFTVKLASMFEKDKLPVIVTGIIGALLTAFSFTFWNNAIEAEVYSGLAFTINLIIWLTFIWVEKSEDFSDQNLFVLIVYTFFLGFCIHQTSLQIAPAILFIIVYPLVKPHIKTSKFWIRTASYAFAVIVAYLIATPIGNSIKFPGLPKVVFASSCFALMYFHLKDKIEKQTWLWAVAFLAIGLSPHFFLYARSLFRPFINEGHPHTLDLFMDYVLRRQYGATSFTERRASFGYQLDFHMLRYFSWQFFSLEWFRNIFGAGAGIVKSLSLFVVTALGLGGASYQYKKNKHSFAYFFSIFFMVSIAMAFVMNLSDQEVRDRDYFFTTAYNMWAVYMAFGALGLISFVKKFGKPAVIGMSVLMLMLPAVNLVSQYKIHDRHKEFIALDYGTNILNSLEEDAIVFTNGDNDTFPVWYAQAVKDPYTKENIYPKTNVSPTAESIAAVKKAMDFKNEQCKGIRRDVSVANLSLLNTPWYIRQMRDREGILLGMPDKQIDYLYPTKLPKEMKIRIPARGGLEGFTITYPKDKILFIKDLATIQIIKENYGLRPIYFAVTVADKVGFEEHLLNEGMVARLVPKKGRDQVNMERTKKNAEEVYTYRGVGDDDIYKDDHMKRLLVNYGSSFQRIAYKYIQQGKYEDAADYFKKSARFRDLTLRDYTMMIQLYQEGSNFDKAYDTILKALKKYPSSYELTMQAFLYLVEAKKIDDAKILLSNAIKINPSGEKLPWAIETFAKEGGNREDAIQMLNIIKSNQSTDTFEYYLKRIQKI